MRGGVFVMVGFRLDNDAADTIYIESRADQLARNLADILPEKIARERCQFIFWPA